MHHRTSYETSYERLSRRGLRTGVSLLAVSGMLLSGCAQGGFSTQASRLGADNGSDSCRQQLVALDNTGSFFGEDIVKGALIGGVGGAALGGLLSGNLRGALIGGLAGAATGAAAGYWNALQKKQLNQAQLMSQVQGDLSRENDRIDATQIAFDQLMDCRFRQADAIRAAYAQGQLGRPQAEAEMAVVKQRVGHDLALAKQINQQIQGRSAQFDVAADNISPGTQAALQSTKPPPRQVRVRRAVPVRVVPSEGAAEVAQLKPSESVTVTGGRAGYAVVETSDGKRGYVAASDLGQAGKQWVNPEPASSPTGDVRSLAGSNAARRDAFADSVAVTEHASATGFELAG